MPTLQEELEKDKKLSIAGKSFLSKIFEQDEEPASPTDTEGGTDTSNGLAELLGSLDSPTNINLPKFLGEETSTNFNY